MSDDDDSEIKDHEARIASLKEEVTRYYALLSQMNDGFGVIDKAKKFTYVNKRFASMLGYTEEEMLGHLLTEFVDEKNKKIVENNIKKRVAGKPSQYELEWTSRNGVIVMLRALFKMVDIPPLNWHLLQLKDERYDITRSRLTPNPDVSL